jgi:hypothetical protein
VAELGQARVARCELDQLAASSGLSLKYPLEHARGANLKALAVALPLPRVIGQLFGFDRSALTENAIGKLAVAALTLSGETTLTLPAFEAKCLIALRWVVHEPKMMPSGNRSVQLRDPEGTPVSLFMPVTDAAKERFGSR